MHLWGVQQVAANGFVGREHSDDSEQKFVPPNGDLPGTLHVGPLGRSMSTHTETGSDVLSPLHGEGVKSAGRFGQPVFQPEVTARAGEKRPHVRPTIYFQCPTCIFGGVL